MKDFKKEDIPTSFEIDMGAIIGLIVSILIILLIVGCVYAIPTLISYFK